MLVPLPSTDVSSDNHLRTERDRVRPWFSRESRRGSPRWTFRPPKDVRDGWTTTTDGSPFPPGGSEGGDSRRCAGGTKRRWMVGHEKTKTNRTRRGRPPGADSKAGNLRAVRSHGGDVPDRDHGARSNWIREPSRNAGRGSPGALRGPAPTTENKLRWVGGLGSSLREGTEPWLGPCCACCALDGTKARSGCPPAWRKLEDPGRIFPRRWKRRDDRGTPNRLVEDARRPSCCRTFPLAPCTRSARQ